MRYQALIAVLALTLPEAAAILPAAAQDRDGAAVITDALDVHPDATAVARRGLVQEVRDETVRDDKTADRQHTGKTASSKHARSKHASSRTAAGSVEMLSTLRRAQREKGNK